MSHIFISYSRKDSHIVGQFIESLRKKDFVVWQDVSNIKVGAAWKQVILDAIDRSEVVLVFWSQATSLSQYVNEEIDYALKLGKLLIPVWLEQTTPLRVDLQNMNAVISPSFSVQAVQKIASAVVTIAPRIQRHVSDFKPELPMNAQTITNSHPEVIGDQNQEYLVIPLVTSAYSNAYLIAQSGTIVKQARRVQLMIQNTKPVGFGMPRDVFKFVTEEDKLYPQYAEPLVGLYVTGAINPLKPQEYWVDPNNVAHYSDMVDTTNRAIEFLTSNAAEKPVFHIFQLTLVDIAFLLGIQVDRWTAFKLYKWQGNTYQPIMNIPPRIP